jgi:hypothetical protein
MSAGRLALAAFFSCFTSFYKGIAERQIVTHSAFRGGPQPIPSGEYARLGRDVFDHGFGLKRRKRGFP